MNIIVITYQLHYSYGSEYAVAWDFITHMNKYHKLTVLYGTSNGFHKIGNTYDMESWLSNHHIDNVSFVPVKLSDFSKEYGWSILGNFLFYRQYTRWHKEVEKRIKNLVKENSYDLIHYVGPIGYREPGFIQNAGLPCVWGPIGGFGYVNPALIKPSYLITGGGHFADYQRGS